MTLTHLATKPVLLDSSLSTTDLIVYFQASYPAGTPSSFEFTKLTPDSALEVKNRLQQIWNGIHL